MVDDGDEVVGGGAEDEPVEGKEDGRAVFFEAVGGGEEAEEVDDEDAGDDGEVGGDGADGAAGALVVGGGGEAAEEV